MGGLIMKIIKTDNLDRDYMSDILIAESCNAKYTDCILDALNAKYGDEFFFSVQDDQKPVLSENTSRVYFPGKKPYIATKIIKKYKKKE